MRTLLQTGFALLYLWVTVGLTVATHFCGGEPVSATILNGVQKDNACCCGDQEPMGGCCSTSITTLRVGDVHTSAGESCVVQPGAEQLPTPVDPPSPGPSLFLPAKPTHPPGTHIPTHILHCSFLI